MKKLLVLFVYLMMCLQVTSQNRMGYTWIVGINGSYCQFDINGNLQQMGSIYNLTSPNYPYAFTFGHSNICDSSTGKLIFLSNGMRVFDTIGNIIENGDSLVPIKMYTKNVYPYAPFTQGSLVIPKGNGGLYYVIIPTATDSTYDAYWTNSIGLKFPYDEILVHIVDMNANGGAGKVIEKNRIILKNVELSPTLMQACRHSNGIDWWLLKHGLDSNIIYRFLITNDSIIGPIIQSFQEPNFGFYEGSGQSAFNKEGNKYAVVKGKSNKLFLADFDRCTGELSNAKVFNIPIDSTSYAPYDSTGARDSISGGIAFSPNGKYLYVSKWWNQYQFEYDEPDSATAWYNIKRGTDTTWAAFEFYGQLSLAPNGKIYIGKGGGGFRQFSVIDSPDNKGAACGFCRKCFRVDNALGGITAPPNMPDYTLGADTTSICWPLSISHHANEQISQLEVYPNPAHTILFIKTKSKAKRELYNSIGQFIFSTNENEIDVSIFDKGIYYLKCGSGVKKVIIE